MSKDLNARFIDLVLTDPANRAILKRMPELDLADAWLVAGCLCGPVWNAQTGQPPQSGVNDYDIFYWDVDTSWEAEDRVIKRAGALFADLGVVHEVRNQARVPLWFQERFGSPYPETKSCIENIGGFIVSCTCLGVRADGRGGFEVCSPKGLEDLFAGVLRRNPDNPTPDRFAGKCASYQARWPWLTVVED